MKRVQQQIIWTSNLSRVWLSGEDVRARERTLRNINVNLGGIANGFPREDKFDITVASEVMAIFCLSTSLEDLQIDEDEDRC